MDVDVDVDMGARASIGGVSVDIDVPASVRMGDAVGVIRGETDDRRR